MARRIDQSLRRPGRYDDGMSAGIRVPLAVTWRGAIVGILGPDPREWQRLQEAVTKVFGSGAPSWIAIATRVDGVTALARSLAELQEGLRVADGIDRRGVIDDLSELGIERLLLSDPDLAAAIVERELGPLLADPRMGDELIETLQVFFDAGERTVARLPAGSTSPTERLLIASNGPKTCSGTAWRARPAAGSMSPSRCGGSRGDSAAIDRARGSRCA